MNDFEYLSRRNAELPASFRKLNHNVLIDPRFQQWPAAIHRHHTGDGGLLRHTSQVVRGCEFFKEQADACSPPNAGLMWSILFTAALWHDYGKIWNYEKVDGQWTHTAHCKNIGHLCRSYAEFMAASNGVLPDNTRDEIGHLILSHHGRREWGSPVEPKTREAHALHLADMASSHVYEPSDEL